MQQRLSAVSRFYAGLDNSFASGASFQASDPSAVHGSVGMASALCGLQKARSEEEQQAALKRMLLLYGLTLSFGGMPLIYMGDEFAQGNDDHYTDEPAHRLDSRWLHRPLWDTALASQSVNENSCSGQFLKSLKSLLHLRRRLPQLAARKHRQLLQYDDPSVLLMLRESDSQYVLFAGNFSGTEKILSLAHLQKLLPALNISHSSLWKNNVCQPADDTLRIGPWEQIWLFPVSQSD